MCIRDRSKSALGSYEADDFKDISHYALIKLAKFYAVTADYLLGLTETRSHSNEMCIRDRLNNNSYTTKIDVIGSDCMEAVSYTHLPTARNPFGLPARIAMSL